MHVTKEPSFGPDQNSVDHNESHHHETHSAGDPFASVGMSLVLGFCFMLLVDQCSRSSASRDVETGLAVAAKRSFTATLGLVVHAAGKMMTPPPPIFMKLSPFD